MTIGKRIGAGFASVIIIALALDTFACLRLATIRHHSDEITKQSLPAIELVYQVQKIAKDNVQIIYQHIGSTDKADMAQLEAKLAAGSVNNTKFYDQLDRLVTSEQGRALIDKVKTVRAANSRSREQVLAVSRQNTNNAQAYALARSQLDPATTDYLQALDNLIQYIKTNTDDQGKTIQSAVQNSQYGILLGLALATLVGICVALVIIRSTDQILNRVAGSLSDGSNQVVSAAGEVSSSSQSLAEGASEQAASLEETSSSLEELAGMTKRNSENAQKANELAKQARSAADKGVGDMQTMSAAMEAIKVSSDDIAKIIRTIDEIAFQTNILALNAAVEAARAGEAGMGFAVVADEVRNLAQRSAQAAKETAAMIEGAISKTGQGVEISRKVSETLNEIVAKVRQVDELVAEMAGASNEQTQGITQINTAVGQMDKVTQSNAASAEESAAAAQELNAQAVTVNQSVTELLQLVGGNHQGMEIGFATISKHRRGTRPAAPAAKRCASPRQNGHGDSALRLTGPSQSRNGSSQGADFKDF
jgi:methyl-accepting chemotaxis protein